MRPRTSRTRELSVTISLRTQVPPEEKDEVYLWAALHDSNGRVKPLEAWTLRYDPVDGWQITHRPLTAEHETRIATLGHVSDDEALLGAFRIINNATKHEDFAALDPRELIRGTRIPLS